MTVILVFEHEARTLTRPFRLQSGESRGPAVSAGFHELQGCGRSLYREMEFPDPGYDLVTETGTRPGNFASPITYFPLNRPTKSRPCRAGNSNAYARREIGNVRDFV
jgi:hypothetical protein